MIANILFCLLDFCGCLQTCVCESSPLCLRLVVLVVATKVVGVFGLVQSTVVLLVVLEENTGATLLT